MKQYFILSLIFFIIDQIIKTLIINSSFTISVRGDFLNISLFKNYGIFAGFSFNHSEFMVILILILFLFLFLKNKKSFSLLPYFFIALFGTISNLIDKVRLGFTVDYINLFNFSHLNIADLLIYIGGVGIIIKISNIKNRILK